MTLTLFQGHRYVRIINCKLFLDSCPPCLMVHGATHIKKLKHSMLYETGRYLRDITNMIFVILHLNVNRFSICSSCLVGPNKTAWKSFCKTCLCQSSKQRNTAKLKYFENKNKKPQVKHEHQHAFYGPCEDSKSMTDVG